MAARCGLVVLLLAAVACHLSDAGFSIFPGTRWCGSGNLATSRNDLGSNYGTDYCCRDHDLCPRRIRGLQEAYGLFNPRLHTIMECDCDQAFRHCLRMDDSPQSNIVGHMFFNQLRSPCFVLKSDKTVSQCAERAWWGRCTRFETVPQAEWRQPLPYSKSIH